MFNDLVGDGIHTGGGNGLRPAQVASAQALTAPGAVRIKREVSFAERYAAWRERVSARFASLDLVPDLAQDVGSRRWLRGAGQA